MPEEINRLLTDHVSNILFCPTQQAVQNLLNEGIGEKNSLARDFVSSSAKLSEGKSFSNVTNIPTRELKSSNFRESAIVPDSSSHDRTTSLTAMSYELPPKVALVGDVMLDAILHYRQYARKPQFEIPGRFILSTIHRAENTDNTVRLNSILSGIDRISKEIPIVLPLHPRTRKTINKLNLRIPDSAVKIVEPVGYLEMLYLLEKCSAVMTDSGGMQKEAFFFKKPCMTLRDETEWVELVEHGVNYIAGAEAESIYGAYKNTVGAKHDFSQKLYGDGNAGEKIVDFLMAAVDGESKKRTS
jgi:UDP-N-acetylglucosamine 2-epimerase